MIKEHEKAPEGTYTHSIMSRKRSKANRQKRFLKAYISCAYNISDACEKTGITRHAVMKWKQDDPEFASKMWEIEESISDFVESQMLKQIRNNNPAMIMWFLETKGKNRGYTRKFEMENNVKIELSTEQIDAMVRAHELATQNDNGKLKMPLLQIGAGKEQNDTNADAGNKFSDTEYRESGEKIESADPRGSGEPGDPGSEISSP